MQVQRQKKLFSKNGIRTVFLIIFIISSAYIPYAFAQQTCSSMASNVENQSIHDGVTLSLQEYGVIGEQILLHVDIPQNKIPTNAWGRVAIKSTVTLKDGTTQKGQVKVLEGVPETTMCFTTKGLYELTISVGYLVKST